MDKRKLLITGGSDKDVPLIEAAQDMGWYVISTGNNKDGQGHYIADEYIPGDFSDKEFVYNLAKEQGVEAVVSGGNDFAYLSTAYACEKLNLPGHDKLETAKTIHIKSRFREMVASLGIKAPVIARCSTKEECLKAMKIVGFPLLVKPVDLTGGKGIKMCLKESETLEAFESAMDITRENYVILEQYIEGTSHGITTLIKNNKVVFYMTDNEQYGINKYLVMGACSPSDIPEYAVSILIGDIEKISSHLGLVDGLFHVQFILDVNGYPVMIDPCRRAAGDLYILFVKYVTGVDYPREIVRAEIGEELHACYKMERGYVARECIMTSDKGILKAVHVAEELQKYIVYSLIIGKEGDHIENPMLYKAGILIMKFERYETMANILRRFQELAWIELEEKSNELY